MLLYWTAIIAGLVLLVWSADRFVIGASATAKNFGVPPLIIGMIIMGFGTSAPEMFVAATAAIGGNPNVAVGNAIGSNIANIALVLGLAAIITPMTVKSETLRREFPALIVVSGIALVLLLDRELSRLDGVILLLSTLGLLGWLYWLTQHSRKSDPLVTEFMGELPTRKTAVAISWTLIGLVALIASSQILVWGAVHVAHAFGISDLVIGLTIIAVGTSLPEIAVSISAARKSEHDMVIGNILGSNMFNILTVLGIAAVIKPADIGEQVLSRDLPMMFILTLMLFIMARGVRGKGEINRLEAGLLLGSYGVYMLWLYFSEISVN
jgi:cation:H+ antiporter